VLLAVSGLGIGTTYGLFGAGGSAMATPVLALLGVPPLAAVASPLPATLPGALVGAWTHMRRGGVDFGAVRLVVAVAAPAAIAGAVLSTAVPGAALLAASGVLLAVVGVRLLASAPARAHPGPAAPTRTRLAAAAGVGLFTGLLANSGGFLLVPYFLLVAGLGMRRAAGTSLLAAATIGIPTAAAHWAVGHIDWAVASAFATGLVPGSAVGSRLAGSLPPERVTRAFGVLLLAFALWFAGREMAGR
jgi:uncharacterized membrane protein YfcA